MTKDISKNRILALMLEVNEQDPNNQINISRSPSEPNRELEKYLSESFLGKYLSGREKSPLFLQNAINIKAFVNYMDKGNINMVNVLPNINFKLFGFLTFTEMPEPYIFIQNSLELLSNKNALFDFNILDNKNSARKKINFIKETFKTANFQKSKSKKIFGEFINKLDGLVDKDIRNAIAHGTYKIYLDEKKVIFYDIKQQNPKSKSFADVINFYNNSFAFLEEFKLAVEEFCQKNIIKDYPYLINWGNRY